MGHIINSKKVNYQMTQILEYPWLLNKLSLERFIKKYKLTEDMRCSVSKNHQIHISTKLKPRSEFSITPSFHRLKNTSTKKGTPLFDPIRN